MREGAGLTWSIDETAALGTVRFRKAVGELLERSGEDRPICRDCKRLAQPPLAEVFSSEEADSRSRDALVLVAHVTHGYRLAEIATFLGVVPSTVSKALSRARHSRFTA